uniref:Secreted protein n=1 Tax=Anopheles darlingi TaxID=43151 RepID=A0A2M4DML2_ANODA
MKSFVQAMAVLLAVAAAVAEQLAVGFSEPGHAVVASGVDGVVAYAVAVVVVAMNHSDQPDTEFGDLHRSLVA